MKNLALQIGEWTERLRAIALTGLAFGPGVYDRERYEDLLRLAADMASTGGDAAADDDLANEVYGHWRAQVRPGPGGYVTPQVGVGAIVFDENERLLLIKRPSGFWHYPTGWADIGLHPAGVVVKEVLEETGLEVTPLRLIAVYDIHRSFESPGENHLYSLVFYCRLDGGTLSPHPAEVLDAGFFARDELPAPLGRTELPWVEHAWAARRGQLCEAFFDRP